MTGVVGLGVGILASVSSTSFVAVTFGTKEELSGIDKLPGWSKGRKLRRFAPRGVGPLADRKLLEGGEGRLPELGAEAVDVGFGDGVFAFGEDGYFGAEVCASVGRGEKDARKRGR